MGVNSVFNRLSFDGVDPKSFIGLPCKASICFTSLGFVRLFPSLFTFLLYA
jgi:hypothetical protein